MICSKFTASMARKLPYSFYRAQDTVEQARNLLGKVLVSRDENGAISSGMITETEAYCGAVDRACHAYGNRRTKRTEVLYGRGGQAYVYLCYGLHHLFNVVAQDQDEPHAILVRAIEPLEGKELMLHRRRMSKMEYRLTAGPGSMSRSMGINVSDTGESLKGSRIWIEDRKISVPDKRIAVGPRIGIDYAGEDASLPYRFWIADNPWVSKG